MKKYNYLEAMKSDIIDYIREEIDFTEFETLEELEEKLNDDLWAVDSVTGNGSGSYTFSRAEAEEYVRDNWDLMREAAEEFCDMERFMKWAFDEDWESIDVSIRCYLLGAAISEALEEMKQEFDNAHAENN